MAEKKRLIQAQKAADEAVLNTFMAVRLRKAWNLDVEERILYADYLRRNPVTGAYIVFADAVRSPVPARAKGVPALSSPLRS